MLLVLVVGHLATLPYFAPCDCFGSLSIAMVCFGVCSYMLFTLCFLLAFFALLVLHCLLVCHTCPCFACWSHHHCICPCFAWSHFALLPLAWFGGVPGVVRGLCGWLAWLLGGWGHGKAMIRGLIGVSWLQGGQGPLKNAFLPIGRTMNVVS